MLDACDKLGMLVMDELSDMWTRTKNPHDYANYFPTHWKQDVWDMVEKDGKTMDRMREDIRRDLSYMTYAPILFISALTGQRVGRLFELINYVNDQAAMRITTGTLNSVLADAQTRVQPPTDKGRRLKIYYMTQVGVKPPHFVIFCNDKKLFHFSYQRYLENQLRSVFGLEGTPIVLTIRQKGEDEN